MPPLVVGKVMGSYISQAQIINKNIKLVPTGAMCKAEIVEVGKMSLPCTVRLPDKGFANKELVVCRKFYKKAYK